MMLAPAQGLPSGSSVLLMGGAVFFGVLLITIAVVAIYKYKKGGKEPWDEFYAAAETIVDSEDADAIALIPYSDGPLVPKPAIYDKELLGGKGGYRTPSGDRIYVDGQGNGTFSLGSVDVITAIDPTEHAAAADPLKSYIAHENDLGRWIKTDREGNVIEAGEGLASMDEDMTPAMDVSKNDGVAADGGYVSEVHRHAHEGNMSLADAKKELESAGLLHKVVDMAPPREAVVDEGTGEVTVEESTHKAIDFSAAANLLPKKTNTTDWQTQYEKAKAEGRDEDKIRENITYGVMLGAAVAGIMGAVAMLFVLFM